MEKNNYQKIAMKISRNTIIANIVLSGVKLLAGIIGSSVAMISDAVHSLSDVISTIIVMIGVKLANKEEDKEHPYGHERFESVAALTLSVILAATGIGIGYGGLQSILNRQYYEIAVPGIFALIAAIISIALKEGMYWYTRAAAKKINSGGLMADAWHHRSDSLSSIGSLIGIVGARMGFPVLDAVACIVICVFILKVAIDIFLDAINKMTDKACDDKTVEEIRAVILAQENVKNIDVLKTRLFGDKIYVDVEIAADSTIALSDSHAIAHNVHDVIEDRFVNVKHCMVHVNPQISK